MWLRGYTAAVDLGPEAMYKVARTSSGTTSVSRVMI